MPIDSSYSSQLNGIWNTYTLTTEITAVPKPVIAAATKNESALEFVALVLVPAPEPVLRIPFMTTNGARSVVIALVELLPLLLGALGTLL
ncbi:MAG: hypothetical protein ACRDF4_04810, partial [Rhabdochlamydiaceae bacterium]